MSTKTISIPDIKLEQHTLFLVGTNSLIVHNFSEKSRIHMLSRQMKTATGGRDARDPYAEFEAARYLLPDGRDGFPTRAFKAAAVTACTALSDVTKVAARQAFQVTGLPMHKPGTIEGSFIREDMAPIISHPPTMREDMVKLSGPGRVAELRYRPEYMPWAVELTVVLNPQVVSVGQMATMFQAAGHGVGVGENRPEKSGGSNGTFEIVSEADFKAWKKENSL